MPTPPTASDAENAGVPRASRFHLASTTSAEILGGLTVLVAACVVALSALTQDASDGLATNLPWVLVAVAFAAVGVAVARRQPHNSIGWILIAVGLLFLLSYVGNAYAVIDYRHHRGMLPLGLEAVFLGVLWDLAAFLIPLTVLLFPNGEVPSRRWSWTLSAYLTILALAVTSAEIVAVTQPVHISSGGSPLSGHLAGIMAVLNNGSSILVVPLAVIWLSWTIRLVGSFRAASGGSRQQLKWLVGGAMLTVIASMITGAVTLLVPSSGGPSGAWQLLAVGFLSLGIAALPIGMGVGILKYRLYEIDRLISRTLSYAIVTGLLIGIYIGLVTLATRVLAFSSPLGVAASTLAAAALFTPLRRRVQRLVDRRFNRARYDAEAAVAAFAYRVRDDVDLDVVRSEFVLAVQSTVEPSQISLWLRPTGSRS
jgi:hypothetical protein